LCERVVIQKVRRPKGGNKQRRNDHHEGGADKSPLDSVRMVPVVFCRPYLDKKTRDSGDTIQYFMS
jgi:hypothetical protein